MKTLNAWLVAALLAALSGTALGSGDPAVAGSVLAEQDPPDRSPAEQRILYGRHPGDPWESFNRKVFVFNDAADRYVLKPVARGYRWVTPQFLENGIGNVFNNLAELSNVLNNTLQGKFGAGASDAGRFLVNTTVGVVGFFDVARRWGMSPHDEDFGQTLGYWGVGSGPYVVIPLLGPRTVRDGLAGVVDSYSDPVAYVDHVPTRNQLLGTRLIDGRAGLLDAEGMVTGDRYIFLRDAYLDRRDFLVNDGVVEDSFGAEDDDWPEWE